MLHPRGIRSLAHPVGHVRPIGLADAISRPFLAAFAALAVVATFGAPCARAASAEEWAKQVTIRRDEWGVPHIHGATDAATVFGVGYAQAEDYFWQIEDTLLQGIGRYSEVVGTRGIPVDLLARNFELERTCREDFAKLEPISQELLTAFAEGVNFYLKNHPETKPRLIRVVEPWMGLTFGRFTMLDWLGSRAGLSTTAHMKFLDGARESKGSNLWAIGPSRTKDKTAMLFVNPHQPWFGVGQWWECHVSSDTGWNMSGATFFAGPFPSIGHNEFLGWTHTANKPDVGDLYKVTFDDPANPLNYRYGDGWKTATRRKDVLRIKKTDGTFEEREYTFLLTHYGPIVDEIDATTKVACRIARLYDGDALAQRYRMTKAKSFDEFMSAVDEACFQMFNIGYADRTGRIMYLYYGSVPKRRLDVKDWEAPVDGADPLNEWSGLHSVWDMPMVLDPAQGYVQNCNQSPWSTLDDGNPYPGDYPHYMVLEEAFDNRRAVMSRHILRQATDVTFEDWKRMTRDSRMHWAMTEIPRLAVHLDRLKARDAALEAKVRPYFERLRKWDCVVTRSSVEATLCEAWYGQMYGTVFPTEKLERKYLENPDLRFQALLDAVKELEDVHGTWEVAYGEIHRMQRLPNVADIRTVPFKDRDPSVGITAGNGAMGTIYNAYFTPSTKMRKRRYGVVGGSFMAVYEFGKERVKSETLLQFGNDGDPKSPHFFDQAEKLYATDSYKPGWFYEDEVKAHTVREYRPGEEAK